MLLDFHNDTVNSTVTIYNNTPIQIAPLELVAIGYTRDTSSRHITQFSGSHNKIADTEIKRESRESPNNSIK